MKKLLLIAVLVLAGVAGVFFVATKPRAPLILGVERVRYLPDGRTEISLWATNSTPYSFYGHVSCRTMSGGVWRTNDQHTVEFVTHFFARSDGDWENSVRLSQQSGPVILLIDYERLLSPRETWCNSVATKLGLAPVFKPEPWKTLATAPIDLPSR